MLHTTAWLLEVAVTRNCCASPTADLAVYGGIKGFLAGNIEEAHDAGLPRIVYASRTFLHIHAHDTYIRTF